MGIDSFEKFSNLHSGNAEPDEEIEKIHARGIELMDEERFEEAFEEFERIVSGDEVKPEEHEDFNDWCEDAVYHQFDILSELGKNEDALRLVNKLLGWDPNDTDYLLGKGFVLEDLERYEESLECYKKLLEIDPDDEDALVNMSSSLIGMKKFIESEDFADKAIKMDVKNGDAWFNKGEALLNLGENRNALKCFENVMEIDRTDHDTWYMKARCLSNLGKNEDDVLDALLVACSLEPENKNEAKEEEDFESLQGNDRFKKIIE